MKSLLDKNYYDSPREAVCINARVQGFTMPSVRKLSKPITMKTTVHYLCKTNLACCGCCKAGLFATAFPKTHSGNPNDARKGILP